MYIYMAACQQYCCTPNGATPNRLAAIKGYGPLPVQRVWATGCPRVWATCLTDLVRDRVHI